MGLRFYKSFRMLPGVRLNLSKSGISTSLGMPGANLNFRRGRRRMTLGLPGTGLSYVKTRTGRPSASHDCSAIDQLPVDREGPRQQRRFAAFLIIAALALMAIVAAVIF